MKTLAWPQKAMLFGGVMTICGAVLGIAASRDHEVTVPAFVLYAPYAAIGLILTGYARGSKAKPARGVQ